MGSRDPARQHAGGAKAERAEPAAGCTPRSANAADPEPGAIGLYAGGKRFSCGIYSPTFDCKMRTLGQPFCVVCQEALRARLDSPYYIQAARAASSPPRCTATRRIPTSRPCANGAIATSGPARAAAGRCGCLAGIYGMAGPLLARLVMLQPRLADLLRRLIFQPWATRLRRRR